MRIEAQNLFVNRGSRPILRSIDLVAEVGTVTVLIGPNGSGKSTLLAALSGDLPPVSGRILLNGTDIKLMAPRALALRRAVLAQETQVAFAFTVAEVVRLGIEAQGKPVDPDVTRRLLAEVDLSGMADRRYHELSGGERQRVHMARVLAQVDPGRMRGEPLWLFLDEPVSSLDIGHQLLVMRRARQFADAGGGVLAVLHDLNLAAMIADSIHLLADGEFVANGPPDVVLTDDNLTRAYRCRIRVNRTPDSGVFLLPQLATAD